MIREIIRKNKIKNANSYVDPDEIFLDAKNIQNFDLQQFEGRLEKPIPKRNVWFLGSVFIIFIVVFSFRLHFLQIKKGEAYFSRSENNTLEKVIIFADRGVIYDRNGKELAWNKKELLEIKDQSLKEKSGLENISIVKRGYISPGFSHLLGYVSSPTQDKKGEFWQTEFIGKDGLEKEYSERMTGENGAKLIETDVHGKVYSENVVNPPKKGADLYTTIDARVQSKLFSIIEKASNNYGYTGGAGIIIDISTGEIITSTSYPEYSSEVLSLGKDKDKIQGYFNDKRKVFLDKIISGVYTPGSIIKPFLALGALNEGIISPDKQILSTGSISIPNPYFKDQKTVFKDWKAHGWTDMREAIAVSSDVYFYTIGGGFEGQKGLGISNIEKYTRMFGIDQKTGIDIPDEKSGNIPNPEWKLKNFKNDPWRIGDTYHTAIGQYGFQVTPLEMARATSALANYGTLITPHFLLNDKEREQSNYKIDIPKNYFEVIHEGMRMTVTDGTATAINVPYVKIAAKTGTAQLGVLKNKVNSWVIGFFPYEKPKYAFVMLMEAGPSQSTTGSAFIIRELFDWMNENTPEYFSLE